MKLIRKIVKKTYAVKLEYRENGKKAAWAYLYIIFQDRHREPYGYLENVYVEQEFRSRGLGAKLVRLAIKEAKKARCYKLIGTSKAGKTGVHRFYKNLGFAKVGFEFRKDFKKSKLLLKD